MIWAAVYERGTIMIRFLLVAVIVIGFLILSIPVLIVEWIIVGCRNKNHCDRRRKCPKGYSCALHRQSQKLF